MTFQIIKKRNGNHGFKIVDKGKVVAESTKEITDKEQILKLVTELHNLTHSVHDLTHKKKK